MAATKVTTAEPVTITDDTSTVPNTAATELIIYIYTVPVGLFVVPRAMPGEPAGNRVTPVITE